MRQYIKIEAKRFFHILPGFFLSLITAALFAAVIVFLAERFLPEVLGVKPFQVGLCMEGEDFAAAYIREYVEQMDSTEGLVEFREIPFEEIAEIWGDSEEEQSTSEEVQRASEEVQESPWQDQGILREEQEIPGQKVQSILEEEGLTACIIIPEKTAQSIMDGSNIPVRVVMNRGADHTERYLQQRLLMLLTECGVTLIDVPQAETLLLYEMQVEEPEEMGRILDLFHFGLVLTREDWFEKETISAFGAVDAKGYYLAAGAALVLLLWGTGIGSFLRTSDNAMSVLLKRRGIPSFIQIGVKQVLFFLWYLVPFLVLMIWMKDARLLFPALICSIMLTVQYSFFFEAVPTVAAGTVLSVIWGLTGFFGAGGVLPAVFLPETLTEICGRLPAGICLKLLLEIAAGKRGAGGKMMGFGFLWCVVFGLAGQLVSLVRQRKFR